jgi:hypothetical protein
MAERGVSVEDVDSILTPSRGVEEFVLSRMTELRIYFSRWPLSGVQGARPPLLQPNSALQVPDVVGEYHRALAAGDVDAHLRRRRPDRTADGARRRPRPTGWSSLPVVGKDEQRAEAVAADLGGQGRVGTAVDGDPIEGEASTTPTPARPSSSTPTSSPGRSSSTSRTPSMRRSTGWWYRLTAQQPTNSPASPRTRDS